ncbi:MAG: cysteine methyltransferase [Deltaproteobacteria bacterium]|nr:MAG: cysteine methyltransferase [Deltaproteobacteria bacterium]
MLRYTCFSTSLCEILLAGDAEGISHLHLNTSDGKRVFSVDTDWIRDDGFFASAVEQITAYASGKRRRFDLPLNPQGTDFQKSVWQELTRIPYGTVRSYKDVAEKLGSAKKARAVGMANSRNPIPLIIPCHRVIATNGDLGGFSSGLAVKKELIALERRYGYERIR